jgi:radical SAM-linked protein
MAVRLRFRFGKTGKVRWTSHRDVARMWERAFRRVRLPLAYTSGFSPRPKVSFGLALPTGAASVAEYLDVELADGVGQADVGLATLPARLSDALPVGIDVLSATPVDRSAGSLQQVVTSCTWEIELAGVPVAACRDLVEAALAADTLIVGRARKGGTTADDIRPAILAVTAVTESAEGSVITCDLATQPRGVRPGELAAALGPGLELGLVRRTHQWIERDGARHEPETTDAPPDGPAPSFPKDLSDVRTDLRSSDLSGGGSPPAERSLLQPRAGALAGDA